MKIAQVAPLYESVPPKLYGGTERIVSYLTEELVRQGHEVTLFASGDSETAADLRAICPRSLRLEGSKVIDPFAHHIRMLEMVAKEAEDFDIIHYHVDYLHFPLTRRLGVPAVTTLHGRLDIPDIHPLFREFAEMHLVSISDAQRLPVPWANWVSTVHHGLPEHLYHPHQRPGNYLAFLGRISPEKRVDRAIEIAIRADMPIKIAAKVDRADKEYFDEKIRKLLKHPLVEYIGEIGEKEKNEFLGRAHALLLPIDWPEPFGLVMIEAMACGTPVIAWKMGSVPEVLEDGTTGFIVSSIEEAAAAVDRASALDRQKCRQRFEQRFTASRMAKDYLDVYAKICGQEPEFTLLDKTVPVAA
ncbi:glycosyltransferase family 4 protein [Pseudacidobacterium ailaaui]|jgi:glycosyltransferase involved in cell wall biosynthesis|uniref:glycosyltransferase family 4 protein n=1 Tax=Pseudacidobacterium ailaaui TaxID=1382359 RepID=UPI00047D71E6|nr:glycosyltransferase family 4 protein [Pseudacidobacterium ailaaui]